MYIHLMRLCLLLYGSKINEHLVSAAISYKINNSMTDIMRPMKEFKLRFSHSNHTLTTGWRAPYIYILIKYSILFLIVDFEIVVSSAIHWQMASIQ